MFTYMTYVQWIYQFFYLVLFQNVKGVMHDRMLPLNAHWMQDNWREMSACSNTQEIPAKAREYVFTGVGLCVCLSVCDHDN